VNVIQNKDALAYFKSVSSTLNGDAELLKSYLGISAFGYLKIFYNNKYLYLASDPLMIDLYVNNVKETIVFCDRALAMQNNYIVLLWPKSCEHYSMEFYKNSNHWNGITLLKKNKDFIELYWFTSEIHNTHASDFYMKNNRLLIAFIRHWDAKNQKRMSLDNPSLLATFSDGVDFSNIDKVELDMKKEESRLKEFLEKITPKNTSIHTQAGEAYITARELECLRLFSKGNTSKEAARILNVSPRTIEGHINNIRSKAGFLYKSDLIKLYQEQVIDLHF
jgi:DNA-binding CsgD family transcriptional regulator